MKPVKQAPQITLAEVDCTRLIVLAAGGLLSWKSGDASGRASSEITGGRGTAKAGEHQGATTPDPLDRGPTRVLSESSDCLILIETTHDSPWGEPGDASWQKLKPKCETMKTAIPAMGLVFLAGCGPNLVGVVSLAGGVSIAEARATCEAWNPAPEFFDASVFSAEAVRDAGLSKVFFTTSWANGCVDGNDGCIGCGVSIAAAVWN